LRRAARYHPDPSQPDMPPGARPFGTRGHRAADLARSAALSAVFRAEYQGDRDRSWLSRPGLFQPLLFPAHGAGAAGAARFHQSARSRVISRTVRLRISSEAFDAAFSRVVRPTAPRVPVVSTGRMAMRPASTSRATTPSEMTQTASVS